ncbi:hypothetical protein [Aureibacter tunicatorum]|uniref:Uncharacterized protein n=1 Tax=Aureibacter tunicatorum TaxID=866807 RepID=A0AAE4BTM7_9BACT|nr:hypothetical protein [Aureibacter tunicatorum]MDR6239968.1 hypothetical protein [Aureibacter tunicatorum]BDD04441.1 hypothetical protein AUTU_19240 [Aureibacter tunicatorum]
MNISLLPKRLQQEYRKFKKSPKKYETELEICIAEIEEKHPEALKSVSKNVSKPSRNVSKTDKSVSKPLQSVTKQAQNVTETVHEPINTSSKSLSSSLKGLFSPINKPQTQKTGKPIKLKGPIAKWLGKPESFEFMLLLRGEPGAGKSRFIFQLINCFIEANLTLAFFSLEMDVASSIVQDYSELYISEEFKPQVMSTSVCPEGLTTIDKAAKEFDVIVIDSWQKIDNVKQTDFDKLRKNNQNTMFIIITQSNSKSGTRGGNMADFDASCVAHVHDDHHVYWEKNRFADGDTDHVYSVFDSKVIR